MVDWYGVVDKKVKEVIGEGDVSHLPGAGEPLIFDDDNTPSDMRLAYKIMKDNDVLPSWMLLANELDTEREKIRRRLAGYARSYQGRLQDALRAGSLVLQRKAEDGRDHAITRIREDIEKFNKKLLNYNLTVPPQIGQKIPLDAEEEIREVFGL